MQRYCPTFSSLWDRWPFLWGICSAGQTCLNPPQVWDRYKKTLIKAWLLLVIFQKFMGCQRHNGLSWNIVPRIYRVKVRLTASVLPLYTTAVQTKRLISTLWSTLQIFRMFVDSFSGFDYFVLQLQHYPSVLTFLYCFPSSPPAIFPNLKFPRL